jgi:hypothetical protein
LFKWKRGQQQQQKEKGNDMRVRQWMYLHQSRRPVCLVQSRNFSGHCRCEQCGGYVNNGDFVNSLAVKKSSADYFQGFGNIISRKRIADGLSVTRLCSKSTSQRQGIRIRKYGWKEKSEFTPNDNE